MTRFLVAVLLILGLCLALGQSTAEKSKIKGLKNKIGALNAKEKDGRQKLNAVRGEMRDVKVDINALDDRLERVEAKYHATEDRLQSNQNEQKRLAQQLEETEAELATKQEIARKRLRYIRMRGQFSAIGVFAGAQNLGDLASRKFIFERVAEKDRDLFEGVRLLRDQIVVKKKRTEHLGKEIAQLLIDVRQQHSEYNEARGEKQLALNKLSDKAEDLEKAVRELNDEEESLRRKIEEYSQSVPGMSGSRPGKLLRPVAGRMGSGYGMRRHPILKTSRMHWGQDIAASSGTPIKAAASGTVITSSRMRGYGNVVILAHGGGMTTLYAHCSALLVRQGQKVARGQVIAKVGSTGLSTGPHLHFEVAIGGKRVNPRGYL